MIYATIVVTSMPKAMNCWYKYVLKQNQRDNNNNLGDNNNDNTNKNDILIVNHIKYVFFETLYSIHNLYEMIMNGLINTVI